MKVIFNTLALIDVDCKTGWAGDLKPQSSLSFVNDIWSRVREIRYEMISQ